MNNTLVLTHFSLLGFVQERLRWSWIQIKSLNLFDSDSDVPQMINQERQTTRLFIVLILIIFTILTSFVAVPQTVNIYNVYKPSQAEYEFLHANYPVTLQCPCNRLEISYAKLVLVNIEYHQICSSTFVSPLFIAQLLLFNDTNLYNNDFMAISAAHFTHIAFFCLTTQGLVSKAYEDFQRKSYISAKLVAPNALEEQLGRELEYLKSVLRGYLDWAIKELVEVTTMVFGLSATYTTFSLRLTPNGSVDIESGGFSNCSCITQPKTCSTAAGFYSYNPSNDSLTLLYRVAGMRFACSPARSTMQSSLACWYSSECYQTVSDMQRPSKSLPCRYTSYY